MKKLISQFKRAVNQEMKKTANKKVNHTDYANKKPMLKKDLTKRKSKQYYELFDKDTMKNIKLNKSSKNILEMCDGSRTLESISSEIYSGPMKKKFLEDTAMFLIELEEMGVLTWK